MIIGGLNALRMGSMGKRKRQSNTIGGRGSVLEGFQPKIGIISSILAIIQSKTVDTPRFMDQILNSEEARKLSRRWFLLSAIVIVVGPACKSTIPVGSRRYAYRVSWHILKEIKKIQHPLSEQDIDMILSSISDRNAREWALGWRKKNLIYLSKYEDADAIILNPELKSFETKKAFCIVMQNHLESPKSVYKDELTE